jgi:hypothetical protein
MDDGYERITLERLSSGRGIPWYCSEKKTPLTSVHLGAPRSYFLPCFEPLLPENGHGSVDLDQRA